MQMINKQFGLVVMLVALLGTSAVQATPAVLTGDTIVFDSSSVAVGPGIDDAIGAFSFDFDAGIDGDEFEWVSSSSAFLGGFTPDMFDLDFNDGSTLVDFVVISTLLTDLTTTIGSDSILFSFSSTGFIGPGTVLSGRFVTSSSAVSVPATLSIVLVGLFGVWVGRK